MSNMAERAGTSRFPPGLLSMHIGERWRNGKRTGQTTLVVTVERKQPADALPMGDNLASIFGAQNVDVQGATPLQLLFASPERFGVSMDALATVEDRLGYPFPPAAQLFSRSLVAYAAARKEPRTTYKPPTGVALGPFSGPILLTCHTGPDAGWRQLRPFLTSTTDSLVVGMYDLTAPHIGDTILNDLPAMKRFDLVLDDKENVAKAGPKMNDRRDEEHVRLFQDKFGESFRFAFAFTDSAGATFKTDYHIKLAVRDRVAFWMSSGSWQSSNQPPLDPLGVDAGNPSINQYNREWHVVGQHAKLAEAWEAFLEWDLEVAQAPRAKLAGQDLSALLALEFFRPVPTFPYATFFEPGTFDLDASKVTALLTPDNYIEECTILISQAKESLLVQNQSLAFLKDPANQDPRYTKFTSILAKQSQELPDFRMIIRDPAEFGGSQQVALATYASKGFNTDRIRFQKLCHNKGYIVDRNKVLVGSHNTTNAGLTTNRDASLIIDDSRVASYFLPIFEHDWTQTEKQGATVPLLIAPAGDTAPPGMVRVSLADMILDG